MTRLRVNVAMAFAWLFFVYYFQQGQGGLVITSHVLGTSAVCFLLLVGVRAFPRIRAASIGSMVLAACLLAVVARYSAGDDEMQSNLPSVVAQAGILAVTVILGWQIAVALHQFEEAAAQLAISQRGADFRPFESAQSELYREVRRSRKRNHRLALLAVSADMNDVEQNLHAFIAEAQRATIHKYITARLADLIAEQTYDYDLITRHGDCFIVLMPETDAESARRKAAELSAVAERDLGVRFHIGISTFPESEVTLIGLLEEATSQIRRAVRADHPEPSINGHAHPVHAPATSAPSAVAGNPQQV